MTKEDIYDNQIGPELMKLATLCKEQGLSMLAMVEYDSAECGVGITQQLADDASFRMIMNRLCMGAGINIDAFLVNLIRYCNASGIDISQSIFLRTYGQKELTP